MEVDREREGDGGEVEGDGEGGEGEMEREIVRIVRNTCNLFRSIPVKVLQ